MKTKYVLTLLAAVSMSAALTACGKKDENTKTKAVVSGNAAVDGISMSSSGTLDGQSLMVVINAATAQRSTYNNITYTGTSSFQPMQGRIDITINGRRLMLAANGSQTYSSQVISTSNTSTSSTLSTTNYSSNMVNQTVYSNIYCSDYNCTAAVADVIIGNVVYTQKMNQYGLTVNEPEFTGQVKQIGIKFNIGTSQIVGVTENVQYRTVYSADQLINQLNLINPAYE